MWTAILLAVVVSALTAITAYIRGRLSLLWYLPPLAILILSLLSMRGGDPIAGLAISIIALILSLGVSIGLIIGLILRRLRG